MFHTVTLEYRYVIKLALVALKMLILLIICSLVSYNSAPVVIDIILWHGIQLIF